VSNESPSRKSRTGSPPHRRLITAPTLPAPVSPAPAGSSDSGSSDAPKEAVRSESTVERVMAYLSDAEAKALHAIWKDLQDRPRAERRSKSDILRAALMLAAARREELDSVLSRQHDSTLARHRNSKISE
jgi:hypothetical protein